MKKMIYFVLFSLLVTFFCLSINNTYSLFTKKVDKTGNINTIKSEATFIEGKQFNAKIKSLAGNNDATYLTEDNFILNISRSDTLKINPTSDNIVSTNDSLMPIYAWFDNGTLYYYSEASTLYMNVNSSEMFCNLLNTTTIDLTSINTSRVQYMSKMFYYSTGITSLNVSNFNTSNVKIMSRMFTRISVTNLDLSSFDTSKVTDMSSMFSQDGELQTITLNFNTSLVTDMGSLFYDCHSLKKLDLSSFDLNRLTASGNMFYNMTALEEFKTPKVYPTDTSVTLDLPETMYDENMVAYTTLGKSTTPTSPTETWLKEGYTVSFDADGETVNPSSKVVRKDGTYGTLPTLSKTGYSFVGWYGVSKNLLDYTEIISNAKNVGITHDGNGNISDSSNSSDNRAWNYNNANWHFTLESGTYTISLTFSQKAINSGAQTNSNISLLTSSDNIFLKNTGTGCLYNIDNYSTTFTINETTNLGLLIKAYDGIYKVQIEKNDTATEWDSYFVTSNSNVVLEQNHTLYAKWNIKKNNVILNTNKGNLIYGLEDTNGEINDNAMHYNINNGVITVTAIRDDGYGCITGRVYLEKEKQYIFNVTSDSSIGTNGTDSVEVYLLIDGSSSHGNYLYMSSFNNYEFTPTKTGLYWIRLDVNKSGMIHTFSNISVVEKNILKEVEYMGLSNSEWYDHTFIEWNTSSDGTGTTITGSNVIDLETNSMIYAIWNPIITLNENVNYFQSTNNTLTNFNNEDNYCLQFGKIYVDNINLNDTIYLEAEIVYSGLTYDSTQDYGIVFQNRGNITSWNSGAAAYNSKRIKLTGTGIYKLEWVWKFDNIGFKDNEYYPFQMRTDYYTGGTINIRNVKARKISKKEVIYNSTYGTLPTPTRTGYTFIGWNTKEDGTGNTIASSSTSTNKDSHTLYAKWQANTYTITFDGNGGDTPYPETKTLTYGTTLGNEPTEFFDNSRSFAKNSSDSMTFEQVSDDTSPSGNAIRITRTANGTSNWAGYYTYYSNNIRSLSKGQTYKITVKAKGSGTWSIGSEQGGLINAILTNEYQEFTNTFVADDYYQRAFVVYAQTLTSGSYIQFQPIELLEYMPTVTRTGYDFDGWYTDSTNGTLVDKDTMVPAANTTYYAHWTLRSATVTFNANGGSVSPTSKIVTYTMQYNELPIPTKTNYSFLGWNTKIDGTGEYINSNTTVDKYIPHTLYAIWQDNSSLTAGKTWDYEYNGTEQRFIPPVSGTYKLETWGAQGGTINNVEGGYGGYTSGNIDLSTIDELYIYVGENYNGYKNSTSFNGGGRGSYGTNEADYNANGGGSTDIRLLNGPWNDFDSLKSRIMVAAGGGGALSANDYYLINGSSGGGLRGYDATLQELTSCASGELIPSVGATQISPGGSSTNNNGKFGQGASSFSYSQNYIYQSGGGSGYYGGGAGSSARCKVSGSSGGSSFISGYSGCDAISSSSTSTNIVHTGQPNHYSGKIFNSGSMQMIDGAGCDWSSGSASSTCEGQIQPDGTTQTGHTGNGYARITLVSID